MAWNSVGKHDMCGFALCTVLLCRLGVLAVFKPSQAEFPTS
jgi:hypothetical protein